MSSSPPNRMSARAPREGEAVAVAEVLKRSERRIHGRDAVGPDEIRTIARRNDIYEKEQP